jgi:hypothetical protein
VVEEVVTKNEDRQSCRGQTMKGLVCQVEEGFDLVAVGSHQRAWSRKVDGYNQWFGGPAALEEGLGLEAGEGLAGLRLGKV